MSATTRLADVSSTGAVAEALAQAAPTRDRLALEVALAVVVGVVVAMLATWAVLATMTLQMSF